MIRPIHLAIALLTLAVIGCAQERPAAVARRAPERPLQLREHIGQRVTLRGRFSLRGKEAPFVLVGEEPVYLIPKGSFTWGEPYASMENREVTVTGVLKRFEPPPAAAPIPDRPVQESPPHFYFEMQDTTMSLTR